MANKDDTQELVESTMSQSRIKPIRGRLAMVAALLVVPAAPAAGQTATVASGTVDEFTVPSKVYPPARHGWVYTPVGYPKSCGAGCNLVLAFDGALYLGIMSLPTTLDSLTAARRTPPTVAILFNNEGPRRLDDLANHETFASFIADELIPWVRSKYAVTRDPSRAIITGSSAGGLAAAYIAFKRPDLFGNVLSQSGAFWRGNEGSNTAPYEWVTSQYSASAKKELRFVLDVGALETTGAMGGAAPSLVAANRKLRDALVARQYRVEYFEVPGGTHSPEAWRLRLPTGIAALAPWR